ncbi:MAG: hypothetical protein IKB31_08335 [Bacteroidaceae bacterium]|nr:hypothetical protein [Bacteroidaceae bacterium]
MDTVQYGMCDGFGRKYRYYHNSAIEEIEDNRTNYQTSVYYMDIVSELEKMGDFMINVSQALDKLHRN